VKSSPLAVLFAAVICAMTIGGSARAAEQSKTAPVEDLNTIHADPSVRQGVLANGLRYVIFRNATPPGAISLRLGIDAGSFDEGPTEGGAAHFDEHLAFSGGHNDHTAGPEAVFAKAGVAFGRDVNAETGLFHTVYRLDLPNGEASGLDAAFGWLRVVADGTSFTKAAVDRERGIILAERASELSPVASAEQARRDFEAPGLRSSRDTIGTLDSLAALDSATLHGFYARWYRPDNAVLVVVGDIQPDVIEKRIEQVFGGWTAVGPPPARPAFGLVDETRGEAVFEQASPDLPTRIQVCRLRGGGPEPADDVARLRGRVLSQLANRILDQRLDDVSHGDKPPYLSADLTRDFDARELRETCLRILPLDEAWAPAVRAAQTELRRFAAHGPTEDELDQQIAELRSIFRGEADQAQTRGTIGLAGDLTETVLDHDLITTPSEDFWAFDAAVETITPRDVLAAFKRDWSGAGPLFSMFGPAPAAQAVRAAWDQAEASPAPDPAPAAPARSLHWAYADLGHAGRPKARIELKNPDFVRVTFDNGVVLNFKHTDFERHNVEVSIRFGAGRREIPNDQFMTAEFGAPLFASGGLRRQSAADLRKLFGEIAWSAELGVGDQAFELDGSTNESSLRSQLQILAAYLSDPGFRTEVDARIPTAVAEAYRRLRTSPGASLSNALINAVAPDSPALLPPEAKFAALRTADFKRVLRAAVTEDPLEVTIVGDVDEAKATEYVAETLGALPPRTAPSRARADTWFLRFPDHDLAPIQATYDGPADKAMVGLTWPLYVATPTRRREEVSLLLLARVFDDALRHRLRQELGKTYGPNVETQMPDYADQGVLQARVETAPADVDLVRAETETMARQLAAGGVTDEALEAARKPIVAELDAQLRKNRGWAGFLSGSSTSDDGLEQLRVYEAMAASVSLAEVKAAAATWLTRHPIVVVVSPTTAVGAKP
jgi:zinc protease